MYRHKLKKFSYLLYNHPSTKYDEWLTIRDCEMNHNMNCTTFWTQKCFTSSFLGQIGSHFGSDGSDEK